MPSENAILSRERSFKRSFVHGMAILLVLALYVPADAQKVIVSDRRQMMKEPLPVIRLEEGDAVVFPPLFGDSFLRQCSRRTLGTGESYWTPLEADVRRSEAALAEYMKKNAPADDLLKGWPDLSRYRRQYVGVVRAGRKSTYANFFLSGGVGDESWRRQPELVCDGGPSFFGVEVDMEANAVVHVAFNGCLCTIVPAESSAKVDPRYARIESEVLKQFASVPADQNALTIGIVENGELAWTRSYGVADFATKAAPDARTIYHIASVSKIVTGIMLLQLAERGVVHLSDPVERYVPELKRIPNPYSWSPPVTLIQLATMTSGLVDKPAPECDEEVPWDKCLISSFPTLSLGHEPGTRRDYSNTSYAILGLALSRAARRPYTEYLVAEIFRPLEMRDSTFSVDASAASRVVQPAPNLPRVLSTARSAWVPSAGVLTTLEDLVKLMRFQLGLGPESVLSHKALENSYRVVVPSDGDLQYGDGVGYAASRNADSDLVALGHGGHSRYITAYSFDRSRKSGIIVLTSHLTDDYKPLARGGLKLLDPASPGGTGLRPLESH